MFGFLVSFSFEREAPRLRFRRAGRLAGPEADGSRNDCADAMLRQLRAASEHRTACDGAYRKQWPPRGADYGILGNAVNFQAALSVDFLEENRLGSRGFGLLHSLKCLIVSSARIDYQLSPGKPLARLSLLVDSLNIQLSCLVDEAIDRLWIKYARSLEFIHVAVIRY
jgi:hypothetical protein